MSYTITPVPQPALSTARVWDVTGGSEPYVVRCCERGEWTCSCPHFRWRLGNRARDGHHCKHCVATKEIDDGTRYRLIAGFSSYAVGDDGSVWSNLHRRGSRFPPGWHRLSIHRRSYGARYVVACLRENNGRGKVTCRYVHRLVLETFVGPANGLEACHFDGDTSNNRLSNLRWDTHAANIADKVRHGTNVRTLSPTCKRGHDLTGAKITVNRRGHRIRVCVTCRKIQSQARAVRCRMNIAEFEFKEYGPPDPADWELAGGRL